MRPGHGHRRARKRHAHTDGQGPVQPVAVGKAACGQGQKHLGQGKQGQQHPDRGRTVALLQGQQGRGHAHARHGGVDADRGGDEPRQLLIETPRQGGPSPASGASGACSTSGWASTGSQRAASGSGKASTFLRARFMTLLRVWARSSVLSTVWVCSLTLLSTSPNLLNSVLTAPSTCQTSLERFSSASVRKPICSELSMAISVVGPASVMRCSRCSTSIRPGRRNTSAYRPSEGRNRMAKSVVCGGSMYFSAIERASVR